MKCTAFFLSVATLAATASAQTSTTPAKPATATTKTSTTATKTTTSSATDMWWLKLPSGIPRAHGIIKLDFALRYEDIKLGTGAVAESQKMYHVNYTGYLAATGVKFDSNADRRPPKMGKDGKPEIGPDGKAVLDDPQPLVFPQGIGRLIPGFDQGFTGMKIGGKRRIFIPWQLAYGTRDLPSRPDHPGIPPKSDLIFDVELVDVTDMPKPPQRPMPPPRPMTPGRPGSPGAPGAAPGAPGAAPGIVLKPSTPAPASGAPTSTAPAAAPATQSTTPAPSPSSTPAQPTQPQK